MTVILINAANHFQTQNCLLLQASVRVNKWSKFFCKIDSLVNCYLGCFILIDINNVCEAFHIAAILFALFLIYLQGVLIISNLWQEDVQGFHTAGSKHFIKQVDTIFA